MRLARFPLLIGLFCALLALVAQLQAPHGALAGGTTYPRGVNLSGGEFGSALPGTHDRDYTYPTGAELDYYKSKGLTLIRLPFRWERLQRGLYAPLDVGELARIDGVVAAASGRGMQVLLDPHNYARYRTASGDQLIGSAAVPNAAFADFWRRVAEHYRYESAIWAYGLMNEPHDTNGLWAAAAQAGVDGVRAGDPSKPILVPGDGWSSAGDWTRNNVNLAINDPAKNVLYEAHLYFDADNSGSYRGGYDAEGAYPTVGVDRAQNFVGWLRARGGRGFLGEYGVPDNDPRWLTVLDNTLSYLDSNGIGGTYWSGGPWWGEYPLSVEPRSGQDRPQMTILAKHPAGATSGGVTTPAPTAPPVPTTPPTPTPKATGPTACPAGQFLAEYYGNTALAGLPVARRCEAAIANDWGWGGPFAAVGGDHFSARWTTRQGFAAGAYTFTARADDGIRIRLDGATILDAWRDQSATTYTIARTVAAGDHEIVVEYYETDGTAVSQVAWSPTAGPTSTTSATNAGTGLTGRYYAGTDFADLKVTRLDPTVDFSWGRGAPDSRLGPDSFSARWTGQIAPHSSETYAFSMIADDGVRLWIDGQLIIDSWSSHDSGELQGAIMLEAGHRYDIRLEYYEDTGTAAISLSWSSPNQKREIVPTAQLYPSP